MHAIQQFQAGTKRNKRAGLHPPLSLPNLRVAVAICYKDSTFGPNCSKSRASCLEMNRPRRYPALRVATTLHPTSLHSFSPNPLCRWRLLHAGNLLVFINRKVSESSGCSAEHATAFTQRRLEGQPLPFTLDRRRKWSNQRKKNCRGRRQYRSSCVAANTRAR